MVKTQQAGCIPTQSFLFPPPWRSRSMVSSTTRLKVNMARHHPICQDVQNKKRLRLHYAPIQLVGGWASLQAEASPLRCSWTLNTSLTCSKQHAVSKWIYSLCDSSSSLPALRPLFPKRNNVLNLQYRNSFHMAEIGVLEISFTLFFRVTYLGPFD